MSVSSSRVMSRCGVALDSFESTDEMPLEVGEIDLRLSRNRLLAERLWPLCNFNYLEKFTTSQDEGIMASFLNVTAYERSMSEVTRAFGKHIADFATAWKSPFDNSALACIELTEFVNDTQDYEPLDSDPDWVILEKDSRLLGHITPAPRRMKPPLQFFSTRWRDVLLYFPKTFNRMS